MNWKLDMYENGQNILCVTDEDVAEYVEHEPESWVHAGDYGWVNRKAVKFDDIYEDLLGQDVLCFTYKGKQYQSNVVIGSRPE